MNEIVQLSFLLAQKEDASSGMREMQKRWISSFGIYLI